MGPTRKSRSVNKRYSYINEVSPIRHGESGDRRIPRKKKLSEMLGPQWSKEELERFYEVYRKHGKDWKKVGAVLRNRSIEMVEALYTMNRAYLSLPEGTASVAGLIAMMTDHYCNLAGSDSEQESNDGAGTSRKPPKRAQAKVQPKATKGSDGHLPSHSQAVASSYDRLPLLKKKRSGGSRPRVVGKRTPRFPVSFSYENVNGEKYFSPSRQGLKFKVNADGNEVAHGNLIALAEASERGGSPQFSQSPKGMVGVSSMDEDGLEGSMEADNAPISRDRNSKSGSFGILSQKGRRLYGKRLEVDRTKNNNLDEIREACSGTEGQILGALRQITEISSSSQGPRKKSKKVLFDRGEGSPFDGLQTLADAVLWPESTNDNDPVVQIKEESNEVEESESLDAMLTQGGQNCQVSGVNSKGKQSIAESEHNDKVCKPGKDSVNNVSPEAKHENHHSIMKGSRKKQKTISSKILKAEAHTDTHTSESQAVEVRDMGKKSTSKGKRSSQSASPRLVKHPENSSSSTDPRKEGGDSALSTVHVPVSDQVDIITKVRSRRKMKIQKPQTLADSKSSDRTDKLSKCISNIQARRWCAFEWFYSAIDYPWFAKREFVEYLFHVGLGHVPRLTHVEWGVIRSSLGKPRRFSEQFLKEEKEKLNQYRESVRAHYTDLRKGTREGLPTDLARPLSVGQRVIAIHPKTREIHDGSVLTVDHNRCRVQFDRPELGVEFVMDIDCMPSNPLENMPTSLAKRTIAVDLENFNKLKMNGHTIDQRTESYMKYLRGENLENNNADSQMSPAAYPLCNLLKQAKAAVAMTDSQAKMGLKENITNEHTAYSHPCSLPQIQSKEADVQALAELSRALEKKQVLVSELREMNNDVLENQKDGDFSLKDSGPFKEQYAAILIQLREANERVSSALYCLKQRNTYQGNGSLTWPRSATSIGDSVGVLSSFSCSEGHTEESASHVNEIVESSRTKACTMVNAAIQAFSSMKGGVNTSEKIEEAIDYVYDQIPLDDSTLQSGRSIPAVDHGNLSSQEQFKCGTISPLQALLGPKLKNQWPVPSELITKCVATLLMIQKCTERQFPPADVAQILDFAVTSLQPCSSQNLPVYADIEKCIIMIRNQIMALVPT